MELDPPHETGPCPQASEGSGRASEEPDPRGFHELAFLGSSKASEAERETEERDIGPEFDSYEDLAGDKLRLLDRYVRVFPSSLCAFWFPFLVVGRLVLSELSGSQYNSVIFCLLFCLVLSVYVGVPCFFFIGMG